GETGVLAVVGLLARNGTRIYHRRLGVTPRIACTSTLLVLWWGILSGAEPTTPKDTLPAQLPLDVIPLGLAKDRPMPKDNPLSESKVKLGCRLFFDPLLSADGTVACASCHHPNHGFAGTTRFSTGV